MKIDNVVLLGKVEMVFFKVFGFEFSFKWVEFFLYII